MFANFCKQRLSILHLTNFRLYILQVFEVCEFLPEFVLFANLRCGAWYVKAAHEECYFKSTDGHYGKATVNTRRLNFNVLETLKLNHGVIIVDSTRRGKQFPDSFSRTIPIWCATVNNALHEIRIGLGLSGYDHLDLVMPEWIYPHEADDLRSKLPEWTSDLLTCGADFSSFAKDISLPLHPVWICRETDLNTIDLPPTDNFRLVIMVSASIAEKNHTLDFDYVQGAGDDEETWSVGLTPDVFWVHSHEFLQCDGPDHVEEFLSSLAPKEDLYIHIQEFQGYTYSFGPRIPPCDFLILISSNQTSNLGEFDPSCPFVKVSISEAKKQRRDLIEGLPSMLAFAQKYGKVHIHSEESDNIAGVALVGILLSMSEEKLSKASIRSCIIRVQTMNSNFRPSRLLLKQLNVFFLSPK